MTEWLKWSDQGHVAVAPRRICAISIQYLASAAAHQQRRMADLPIPDWLTADFLKSCLETDLGLSGVTVTEHSVEPAVAAGNNYGSLMFRVKIHFKLSENKPVQYLPLIVKAPITTTFFEKFSEMYYKEPRYYNEFITETHKLCKHDIVPRHYVSPNPLCVVMEDLKESGYEMVDRRKLLDLDHSKAFIHASAKLQALSIAVNNKNPELVRSIIEMSPESIEAMDSAYRASAMNGLMCMSELLEGNNDYQDCKNIIDDLIEGDKFSKLFKEMENSECSLKSLAQMDPWCTNMMFKYDSSRSVVGVKLLDFQTTKYMSPVFEFVTFLWASVRPDVRKLEINNLYKFYLQSLNDSLTQLGCPERLTEGQLKAEALKLSPLCLMIVCSFLPFSLHDGVEDVEDIITTEVSRDKIKECTLFKMYQDVIKANIYPDILNDLMDVGVFDHLKEQIVRLKRAGI